MITAPKTARYTCFQDMVKTLRKQPFLGPIQEDANFWKQAEQLFWQDTQALIAFRVPKYLVEYEILPLQGRPLNALIMRRKGYREYDWAQDQPTFQLAKRAALVAAAHTHLGRRKEDYSAAAVTARPLSTITMPERLLAPPMR